MKFLNPKFYLLFIPAIAFIMFSCQPQRNLDEIKSQIAELNKKYANDMLNKDFLGSIDLYADDALSLPSYSKMMRGKAAIKAQAEKEMEQPMNMSKFELTTTDVMLAGNYVIEVGTYDLTFETPEMPDGMEDVGKYITIYEFQEDGSLKIKVETWNSDANPWEMMQEMKPEDTMGEN